MSEVSGSEAADGDENPEWGFDWSSLAAEPAAPAPNAEELVHLPAYSVAAVLAQVRHLDVLLGPELSKQVRELSGAESDSQAAAGDQSAPAPDTEAGAQDSAPADDANQADEPGAGGSAPAGAASPPKAAAGAALLTSPGGSGLKHDGGDDSRHARSISLYNSWYKLNPKFKIKPSRIGSVLSGWA